MRLRIFDPNLKRGWRRYLGQVGLAAVALFVVLWAQEWLIGSDVARAVLVAAIASTAFLLFILPHGGPSQPRNTIGGHMGALLVGVLFALFAHTDAGRGILEGLTAYFALFAALGVGISMFLMAATDTEHPPAAGTVLGVLGSEITFDLIVFVLTSVLMLVLIYLIFRRRLVNLY